MNSFINYILEANVCLLALGGFYFLVLKRENHFQLKRIYVLLAILISLSVPQFDNPFIAGSGLQLPEDLQVTVLPSVMEGVDLTAFNSNSSLGFGLYLILAACLIYLVGVLVLLALLLYQLYLILKLFILKKDERQVWEKQVIIPTDGKWPTFSFFNLLFFDNTVELSYPEKQKIVDHERAHIRQFHSVDILLIELVKAFFWVNPITWMLRRSMQNIHEFLADESVIKNSDTSAYGTLLVKIALTQKTLSLSHHFNRSLTLKRIAIMKAPKKKPALWKWAAVAPLVMLITLILSCHSEMTGDDLMEEVTQLTEPLKPDEIRMLDEIVLVGYRVDKNLSDNDLRSDDQHNDLTSLTQAYPVTTVAGAKNFYNYFARNMKYPKEARMNGVEGKVFVQFGLGD